MSGRPRSPLPYNSSANCWIQWLRQETQNCSDPEGHPVPQGQSQPQDVLPVVWLYGSNCAPRHPKVPQGTRRGVTGCYIFEVNTEMLNMTPCKALDGASSWSQHETYDLPLDDVTSLWSWVFGSCNKKQVVCENCCARKNVGGGVQSDFKVWEGEWCQK